MYIGYWTLNKYYYYYYTQVQEAIKQSKNNNSHGPDKLNTYQGNDMVKILDISCISTKCHIKNSPFYNINNYIDR